MKIGFIGMGNMAGALAAGFADSKVLSAKDVGAYAPNQAKLIENSKRIGFVPFADINRMVSSSDIVIVACKPYQIEGVLEQIKKEIKGKALLSIAAGWTFDTYEKILGNSVRIQCIMPNTPASVYEGVLLFEEKNSLTEEEHDFVTKIFGALGLVEEVPTSLMGIGGAVAGCTPAFMDMIVEAYADAAVKYGMGRAQAYRIVSQMMLGSAKLIKTSGKHPAELKDAVCSPAGTTIRGVEALEKAGLRSACMESVKAVMDFKNVK